MTPHFPFHASSSGNPHRKMSSCGHLLKKCLGEDFRPSAGLCLIAFAIPLIVPGITLTVVAFEDQLGFPKYGALHILGMALLVLAVLLIAFGILLNTRRSKFKMAADDMQLMESNQEKPAKDININKYGTSAIDDCHHASHNTTPEFASKLPSYNSAVKLTEDSAERSPKLSYTTADVNTFSDAGQKQSGFSKRQNSSGKFSSSKSVGECSSSFDSIDSDDFSSGSYILSEEIEGPKSIQEFDLTTGYVNENYDVKLFSTFKPDQVKKQAFSFENIISDDAVGKGSAAALSSVDNQGFILKDPGEIPPSSNLFRNKMALIFDNINKQHAEAESINSRSTFTSEIPVEANSPGSRQRLHGLSSEAFTASSEILTRSSDSVKNPDVFSEITTASSCSVFSLGLVGKHVKGSAPSDSKEKVVYTQDIKPVSCKTWAQSPTTNRPHSFPCGGGISELSTAVVRIHSLNDTYVTSLGEFSR